MRSTFIVTTPAVNKNLTTLDRLKTTLGITTTDEDDYLESQIEIMSEDLCSYLGVNPAQDGTFTLARESLQQTVRLDDEGQAKSLFLSRLPVSSIASVTEDGVVIDPSWYEFNANSGLLYRLWNDRPGLWCARKIIVAYAAGWLMPDDGGRNLPLDLEAACTFLIKSARFDRTRDPSLRSENILNGLYAYTLFDPDKADEIASQVASKIDRYRMPQAA